DMQVVLQRPADRDGRPQGICLTDGFVNLDILRAGMHGERYRPEGLQGIGFLVEDLEEVEALAPRYGAMAGPARRNRSEEEYAEAEVLDPLGISVELSERGFGVDVSQDVGKLVYSPDPWAPRAETNPRIQHIATGPYDQ